MRLVRGAAVISVAALCAWMLAGCVPAPANVIPTSVPTAAPVFASEDEALAAAVKAYEGYTAASDEIANDGGSGSERISNFVTPEWLSKELEVFKALAVTGHQQRGKSSYSHLTLERLDQSSDGIVQVVIYVCADLSGTRVVDATGKDITPSSRVELLPIEASFQGSSAGSTKLLFAGSEPWPGHNFCQ